MAPAAPYFVTETGQNWTPIGQNDALTWPDLAGLFCRRNVAAVEGHLAWLAAHGVTCLRLMLEYCQTEHRYLERPVGRFQPNMVRFWDDLFALCARYGLRVLLTPYDTFWMARRWRYHPYSRAQGGPGTRRSQWLSCPRMRQAIKDRLSFAAERWGSSGALFAWDLWNEIDPAHAGKRPEALTEFISDLSAHVRAVELRCFGRTHLQTVSVFGPVLGHYPTVAEVVFQHPQLDFATTHFYEAATINNPKDTLGPARATGALVREALAQLPAARPFFDSEHGPIYTFNNRHRTLPEAFDDEYFRHMQWAHLASGGAGGGLRWPYRQPHVLTHGMRAAQRSLAAFTELLDWKHFQRRNLSHEVAISSPAFAAFACGDTRQAVVWLLRQDRPTTRNSTRRRALPPRAIQLTLPGLAPGAYRVHLWNTVAGTAGGHLLVQAGAEPLRIDLPAVGADLALAIVAEG
ncbi:hypothetical protein GO988_04015 [Hymenobacter sp. HMF4947]|uniref:Glycoside hydrolase family 5 domain-containing protein n=1 Tax=Hymenobacter ginkgonis TaxID=2682976 RepID=A0A7K1TAR9_9BACT|nr:hypothetical protein [Hymenobacter ginkgonis]